MKTEENNLHYWADHFDRQIRQNPDDSVQALNFSNYKLMNQVHQEIISSIDKSRLQQQDRFLDTGCGTGKLLCKLIFMLGSGYQYHATDISQAMLKKALENLKNELNTDIDTLCRFFLMSVDDMRFDDQFFSLILACESLQYTDPYQAILDLIRMTRKDGQVILSIPNKNSPFIQKAMQKHKGRFAGADFSKIADLTGPKVSSFSAKPLIFRKHQDKNPYFQKKFKSELSDKDIQQANRFVIHLII